MNSGHRRAKLLAVLVGVVAAFAISAASASAVIVKVGNGRVFSYQPLRGSVSTFNAAFGNLDYNGGPVMPSNTDFLVFWSPTGLSAYPAGYTSGLGTYMTDLAHDSGGNQNVDSVSSQYGDATGQFANYSMHYGGTKSDTDPYPASECPVVAPTTNCLVDSQLQTELSAYLSANHLPRDLHHEYFLLLPPHVENCFDNNVNDPNGPYGGCSAGESANPLYCAYHGNSTSSPIFIYSNDPYVTGNPGCDDGNHPNGPSDGALEGGLSHEHNESVTDPLPNSAWTNMDNGGEEIGDQCAGVMGPSLGTHNGAKYNQVINGHFYWYQTEWSNQGHHCLQRFSLSGSLPTAKFTDTAGSGRLMTFNASGSSGSPSISWYDWQFNDGPGLTFPDELTTNTDSHTFPSTNPFVVGLTVLTTNGTSGAAGGIVTPGTSGFTPGFTFTPSNPTAGSPISFSAITKIAGRSVTAYAWDFGDGSERSGAKPTHTFATAGTYTVRVSMFSSGGPVITSQTITVS